MDSSQHHDDKRITEIAEDLLTRRYGGTQKLHDPVALSGSGHARVIRARVTSNPFLPHRTVILKQSPRTGDLVEDAAFLREVASYQFTTSLAEEFRPGPVILAHDCNSRLIVLSDSGDGDTFADLLEESDPEKRVQILRALGTSLGRMHSGTAGKEEAFNILLGRLGRNDENAHRFQEIRERLLELGFAVGLDIIRNAGIEVPLEASETMPTIQRRLRQGRYRAFTPFDLSPDNIIVSDRTEFLDYEWAGFRDVSFDLACVIAGFPQYISLQPISDDEAAAFTEAWLHEVDELWPGLTNEDVLHERITIALVGWAFSSVTVMYYGSLANIISSHAAARDYLEITMEDLDRLGINSGRSSETNTNLLKPAKNVDFTEDELLVRRDLYETFEALGRFAAAGRNSSYSVLSEFAFHVAEILNDSRL
ncbi:aminoglycoside phosphotransferase family protein [Corynebacterium cystitidis]|uniref:aminoglycoside phosphotransferase family protein n=1 Tax=Corynebacterium cystitidis TaxID=35757 RepID=UPI00211E468A|nr:aminoglycoside phosphotransferase family protein [Corynebacterium cystitidis]